jgi:sulfate/thiosulfate-binding protein
MRSLKIFLAGLVGVGVAVGVVGAGPTIARAADVQLLNVSYDPTRELYQQVNAKFAEYWKAKTGQTVTIQQSHGGSGKQARAVIDGLEADVVTLALAGDIDAIAKKGQLLSADWQKRLPNQSSPYTSTIVYLVRKGNPKQIKNWDDLVKPDVQIIVANPKTSGGARWAYLAAWGQAYLKGGKSDEKAKAYITEFYHHVPVLDSGARGATTTFAQRGIGDVLVSWENEAYLAEKEFGADQFDIVYPPSSILAEPPVAVVDQVVDRHGTRQVAEEYLKFLYTADGQEIAAQNHYRPRLEEVAKKYESSFPKIELFTIEDVAGGWSKAQPTHFNDGGVFDQIYSPQGK